mmetsp:Transcript_6325/g.11946  ORF Transcript_6325/g.11946 Transcript_6325/m.11946 type:complete len:266 (+) Transcript_6325:136-933(+)
MKQCQNIALVFVGDSDIARWPKHLLPQVPAISSFCQHRHKQHHDEDPKNEQRARHVTTFHHAQNGATMQSLASQIKRAKKEISSSTIDNCESFDVTIFIACAGENDLSTCSNTTSSMLDRIMEHFESAVQSIFSIKSSKQQIKNPHLIFIGPKVEPWMEQDDLDARMSYFQLSERLRSCIAKLSSSSCPIATKCKSNSIFYLDSLTLFCGETSNKSVVGGQAIAQRIYFHEDELHLSQNGYEIWKNQVDDILSQIMISGATTDWE